jgi:hypothetical protein
MVTMTKLSYETADGEITMGLYEKYVDHELETELYFGDADELVKILEEEFGYEALPT